MGVINVTPDSFSDGGAALDPANALDIAQAMEAAGADLIDVGAESTRPGAEPVGAADEIARLLPVLRALAAKIRIPLSIDTYKAEVAAEALDEGAAIVNDISGLQYDAGLGAVVARRGAPVILMHTRGRPSDMYEHAEYGDVVADIVERPAAVHRSGARVRGRTRSHPDRPGPGFCEARRAELRRACRDRSPG